MRMIAFALTSMLMMSHGWAQKPEPKRIGQPMGRPIDGWLVQLLDMGGNKFCQVSIDQHMPAFSMTFFANRTAKFSFMYPLYVQKFQPPTRLVVFVDGIRVTTLEVVNTASDRESTMHVAAIPSTEVSAFLDALEDKTVMTVFGNGFGSGFGYSVLLPRFRETRQQLIGCIMQAVQ